MIVGFLNIQTPEASYLCRKRRFLGGVGRQVKAMKRWMIAVPTAGLLAACLAVSAQAAEWCLRDPQLTIQASHKQSLIIYVTEGAMGSQHQPTLASSRIAYATRSDKNGLTLTVYDYIPSDHYGTFATEMIVSSQPFGTGLVYGFATGTSGTTMTVRFRVNSQQEN